MRVVIAGAAVAAALGAAGVAPAHTDLFSEVRLGVLAHDPLAQKEDGIDLNAELYFDSWTEGSWQLRPSIGGTVNLDGDTSQLYVDMNYGGPITDSIFVEFAVGGAIHDGKLETADPDRKELGSSVLIHAAVSVGVMLTDNVSLSLYVDHISNAGIEKRNEGLETAGVRVGFKF